jgi:hypothetical protein
MRMVDTHPRQGQLRRVFRITFRSSNIGDPAAPMLKVGDLLIVICHDVMRSCWQVVTQHGTYWVRDEYMTSTTEVLWDTLNVLTAQKKSRVRP